MKLLKLTPETLIDTLIEIRFTTEVPHEAIFGLIYSSLRDKYKKVSNALPIPREILNQNQNLKYTVTQKMFNDKLSLGVGSSIITFSCSSEYITWKEFFPSIKDDLDKIDKLKLLSSIERIGLRYISFFEGHKSFIEKTNININQNIEGYENENMNFSTYLKGKNNFDCNLAISSDIGIIKNSEEKNGGLLDIDISYQKPFEYNLDTLLDLIEKAHDEEKSIFLKTVKKDFLKEEYNAKFEE